MMYKLFLLVILVAVSDGARVKRTGMHIADGNFECQKNKCDELARKSQMKDFIEAWEITLGADVENHITLLKTKKSLLGTPDDLKSRFCELFQCLHGCEEQTKSGDEKDNAREDTQMYFMTMISRIDDLYGIRNGFKWKQQLTPAHYAYARCDLGTFMINRREVWLGEKAIQKEDPSQSFETTPQWREGTNLLSGRPYWLRIKGPHQKYWQGKGPHQKYTMKDWEYKKDPRPKSTNVVYTMECKFWCVTKATVKGLLMKKQQMRLTGATAEKAESECNKWCPPNTNHKIQFGPNQPSHTFSEEMAEICNEGWKRDAKPADGEYLNEDRQVVDGSCELPCAEKCLIFPRKRFSSLLEGATQWLGPGKYTALKCDKQCMQQLSGSNTTTEWY